MKTCLVVSGWVPAKEHVRVGRGRYPQEGLGQGPRYTSVALEEAILPFDQVAGIKVHFRRRKIVPSPTQPKLIDEGTWILLDFLTFKLNKNRVFFHRNLYSLFQTIT